MGTKRVGLARVEALIENLKRDLDLSSARLTLESGVVPNHSNAVTLTGNTTLSATTHGVGKPIVVTAAATITLPSTAANVVFWIINGADDGTQISISPAAADKFVLDAAGAAGTDNKDLVNTAATARKGDYVKLRGDGSDGWVILELGGTWADEA